MQLQHYDATLYSRFTLKQDGQNVSGLWYADGKQIPFDGTYDGRLFHFVVKTPAATLNMTGYVENATDMVGIVDNGKGQVFNVNPVPFTAEHRAPAKPLTGKYTKPKP